MKKCGGCHGFSEQDPHQLKAAELVLCSKEEDDDDKEEILENREELREAETTTSQQRRRQHQHKSSNEDKNEEADEVAFTSKANDDTKAIIKNEQQEAEEPKLKGEGDQQQARTRTSIINDCALRQSTGTKGASMQTMSLAFATTATATTTTASAVAASLTKTTPRTMAVSTVDDDIQTLGIQTSLPPKRENEQEQEQEEAGTPCSDLARSLPTSLASAPGAYRGSPGEPLRPTANFTKCQLTAPSLYPPLPLQLNADTPPPSHVTQEDSSDVEMQHHHHHQQQQQQQDNDDNVDTVSNNKDLVLARQVSSSHIEVDNQEVIEVPDERAITTRKGSREDNKKWLILYVVLGGLLGLTVIMIATVLGLQQTINHRRQESPPTTFPPLESSDPGNQTLFGVDDATYQEPAALLIEGLPNYTLVSLEDPFSAQSQAYNWLLESYPNMVTQQGTTSLPQWRRKQLFALATFYFAFDGPTWMTFRGKKWVDPTKHECDWWSRTFGKFNLQTNTYAEEDQGEGKKSICNDMGEYTDLNIVSAADAGVVLQNRAFPPEVSLLTSLTKLQFRRNGVMDTLDGELFPRQVYQQLTNLELLKLGRNSWNASIPSDIALLTNLQVLSLNRGNLFGTLPTELGLLTSMKRIYLGDNSLSGPIPTTLSSMTDLLELTLQNNQLSGTVPSVSIKRLRIENNPMLSGVIPEDLCSMDADAASALNSNNDSCTFVDVAGNQRPCLLKFDCTNLLCGCDCSCQ